MFTRVVSGKDFVGLLRTFTMEQHVSLWCFAIFILYTYKVWHTIVLYSILLLDAGIPEAVACLNNSTDSGGDNCSNDVKLCVESGTTTLTAAIKVLPKENIIESPNLQSVFDDFIAGKCTAIAGGRAEVAPTSAKKSGYDGAYEVGAKLWLRDPLAMAGRDDDQRWCDVIFWTQ